MKNENLLNKEQIERFKKVTNFKDIVKVDITHDRYWKVTHMVEYPWEVDPVQKTIPFYWNNLPSDHIKKEFVLTGVERVLDWTDNSCVDRTEDEEWKKTHYYADPLELRLNLELETNAQGD